jgi:UPF0755 protein
MLSAWALHNKKLALRICVTVICLVAILFLFTFRAPAAFPDPAVVVISDGMSLTNVARTLKKNNIIRSSFLFTNSVIFLNYERKIKGGEYYFEKPLNVIQIAKRVSQGDYNIDQLKTTIPEGSSISDISLILKKQYPLFDSVHFVTLAQGKEGYLFPDTYYFGANASPERIIDALTMTFNKKIQQPEVAKAIADSGKSLSDIITMASILEGEARQTNTRQIVAGILWERLNRGIPLQVDAAFKYVNGKTTDELTLSDLKIDSPYNTYLYRGLPPTPISNPGLDSIMAAATPIKTDYLYFLTDREGVMHYAKTLEEHAENKNQYLSN